MPEGNNEGQNPKLKFSHNPKMWPDLFQEEGNPAGEDSESGTGSPRMGLGTSKLQADHSSGSVDITNAAPFMPHENQD